MTAKTPFDEGYKAFGRDECPNRCNPYIGAWSGIDIQKAKEWREGWDKAAADADRCSECGQFLPRPPGGGTVETISAM